MLHKQALFCPIWYCSENVINGFVNAKSSQILEYLSIQLLLGKKLGLFSQQYN